MLRAQPKPPRFTGGLEARRITRVIARELIRTKFDIAYLAYDIPGERKHVARAIAILRTLGGWSLSRSQRKLGCYVLCGYGDETIDDIDKRLRWVVRLGATPFPMFYQVPGLRKAFLQIRPRLKLERWFIYTPPLDTMRQSWNQIRDQLGLPGVPSGSVNIEGLEGVQI